MPPIKDSIEKMASGIEIPIRRDETKLGIASVPGIK